MTPKSVAAAVRLSGDAGNLLRTGEGEGQGPAAIDLVVIRRELMHRGFLRDGAIVERVRGRTDFGRGGVVVISIATIGDFRVAEVIGDDPIRDDVQGGDRLVGYGISDGLALQHIV